MTLARQAGRGADLALASGDIATASVMLETQRVDIAAARQIMLQAEITTFNGFAGGAALIGNAIAKHANPDIYPATLDEFSYLIADGLLTVTERTSASGSIRILSADKT